MSPDEPELTAENVGQLLGLTPKPQTSRGRSPEVEAEPPDVDVQPEAFVSEISDTNDQDADDVEERLTEQEKRDAALWAAGIPPARTAAQKREVDRAFAELIHKPPEDAT